MLCPCSQAGQLTGDVAMCMTAPLLLLLGGLLGGGLLGRLLVDMEAVSKISLLSAKSKKEFIAGTT